MAEQQNTIRKTFDFSTEQMERLEAIRVEQNCPTLISTVRYLISFYERNKGLTDTVFHNLNLNKRYLNEMCIRDRLQIVCKDLNSIKDYDLEFDIMGFSGLYKTYADDIKIVTMNYPVNVRSQIAYCRRIQEQTENPACMSELDSEVEKLEYAHENFHER